MGALNKIKPIKLQNRSISFLLLVIGTAGLIVAALLFFNKPKAPTVPVPKTAKTVLVVAQAPSSVKPTPKAVEAYNVPPLNPKFISIPTINISNVRIKPLSLGSNKNFATPDNIYDTGWYTESAKPGQAGAMFIYGHISNWTANGVFYNLKKLRPGDRVKITRGDNTNYTYQVVSTKTYAHDNVDMNEVLSPVDAKTPGLNLMTCSGKVIKGTNDFDQRLVVFTSLVND